MAIYSPDKDRKVIPRWRSFKKTRSLGELSYVAPPTSPKTVQSDFLAQKHKDWRKCKTEAHAADLVGAAITLGREAEVTEPARFLLNSKLNVSPWARELAEHAVNTSVDSLTTSVPIEIESSVLWAKIKTVRQLLNIESRDPITWAELSRVYAILGLNKQAERAMTIALQLANNNRFILRSASRLWIHLDDPERAHDIIHKADITRYDPWLLAAEIAIGSAADRKPRFIKEARQMVFQRRFPLLQLSELSSALATLEMDSGSQNKSKKLFRISLKDPTENSIAQAAWASRKKGIIQFREKDVTLPNAFEAKSWVLYLNSQWKNAVQQYKQWQFDQSFSSRPSILGSYVTGVALENHETSKWFAEKGLIANPRDFVLLNNLAFAQINLGEIEGARKVLARVGRLKLSDRDRVVLKATQGLLQFRSGNPKEGRQLYMDAISKAQNMKQNKLSALACAFHAFEEITYNLSDSGPMVSIATKSLKRVQDPIFKVLEQRLTRKAKRGMIRAHR